LFLLNASYLGPLNHPFMARRRKKTQRKHGLPPGTLIFTGDRQTDLPDIVLVQYNENEACTLSAREAAPPVQALVGVAWYDVRGLHHVPLIEQLGQQFGVHSLALEDVLDIQQRAKFEDYDNAVFLIAQALTFDDETQEVQHEQIAIYAGKDFVLSFQEKPDDTFAFVRERILNGGGKIRKRGSDYLVYALLDTIVDHYYLVLDKLEELIDAQERQVLSEPDEATKRNIHHLKVQVLALRKSVYPLRDAVNSFSHSDNPLVQDSTRVFIRDIYDHIIQIMDAIDTWRDVLNGLFDLYLSQLSFRMNNVMQVLTIISTIFIPLTFIVGVYGMNFHYMPELEWRYGYFAVWGAMLLIALLLLYLFRRRGWL